MENFRLAIHEPDIHSLPNLKTATTTTTNAEQDVCVRGVGGNCGGANSVGEGARW